jgi:hypothetical protein
MMTGPFEMIPEDLFPANPGSQPLFLGTKTCNRPFIQPKKLDFRDRLLKAPATVSSYDGPCQSEKA